MKKFFVLIISFCIIPELFSIQKKDVIDPVLQGIIDYFESKLPKFLDKYGKDRYVADEPITRGSLLFVLYEYDQTLKKLSSASVTPVETNIKQDIDSIRKRLGLLEEKLAQSGGNISGKGSVSKSSSVDIFEIINDITPNMPMLLDSTLSKSEVFKSLKQEVENLKIGRDNLDTEKVPYSKSVSVADASKDILMLKDKVEKLDRNYTVLETRINIADYKSLRQEIDELKANINKVSASKSTTVSDTNRVDIVSLKERLEKLEKNYPSSEVVGLNKSDYKLLKQEVSELKEIVNSLSQKVPTTKIVATETSVTINKDLLTLKDRVDKLEKNYIGIINEIKEPIKDVNVQSKDRYYVGNQDSELGSYFSILTKLSLGVSIVALLFVAR